MVRPRIDCDQHKDLILQLYAEKTPWTKIEEILLTQHGCKVKARTIIHRFKEWDTSTHRVKTDVTDELKAQVKAYWADRDARPKTDEELLQKLVADGFTVSLNAVTKIRNELRLFRRWDHRLGRVRPQSELHKARKNRRQKGSAFTDAQLAPLDLDMVESSSHQQPGGPRPQTTQPGSKSAPAPRKLRQRRQAPPSQPVEAAHPPPQINQQQPGLVADPSSANKDA